MAEGVGDLPCVTPGPTWHGLLGSSASPHTGRLVEKLTISLTPNDRTYVQNEPLTLLDTAYIEW